MGPSSSKPAAKSEYNAECERMKILDIMQDYKLKAAAETKSVDPTIVDKIKALSVITKENEMSKELMMRAIPWIQKSGNLLC